MTENGFMDSEVSPSFLESEEGKKAIVALHVEGITLKAGKLFGYSLCISPRFIAELGRFCTLIFNLLH
jgi:hypothetical protein